MPSRETSPNRGKEQARRGMVDVLQGSNGLSLRTRVNKPTYCDPNSSDDGDDFEESTSRPSRSRGKTNQPSAAPVSSNSETRPTRSSRHTSRLEQYEEEAEFRDDIPLRSSSRRSSSHRNDSLSLAVSDSNKRSNRRNLHPVDIEEVSGQRYPRRSSRRSSRDDQESDVEIVEDPDNSRTYNRSSRRSSRSGTRHEVEINQDEEDEEEEEDEDEDEDEEEEEEEGQKKYSLRDRNQHKRETLNVTHLGGDGQSYLRSTKSHREKMQPQQSIYREPSRVYLGGKISIGGREKRRGHGHHRHYHKRRHFDSSSDSSDGSEGSDKDWERRKRRRGESHHMGNEDLQFREHEEERVRREMASIMPFSLGGRAGGMGGSVLDKASRRDIARADVTPVAVDPSVGFASVGGLDKHVKALKEMVVLPLLYPDIFKRFDTQPPRGVLFVGPPGTGKTLTARALANSLCAGGVSGGQGGIGGRKVSFFMRKGADCLSKWVGEGERQLRLLFEQAKLYEPSIIFFDEIDGLAPVRSIKQDQIHASIVSTLLALMDGLDSRGQVVVIGATNRPDAIDPALRRPGRFDRELMFPLPDATARRAILDIHTASWQPPLQEDIKQWIVDLSGGYCGADMKALCSEAAIISLRRAYPQVYSSNVRLEVDPSTLVLTRGDFAAAFSKVIPASRRSSGTPARALEGLAAPLLAKHVDNAYAKALEVFAPADKDLCTSLQSADGTGDGKSNGGELLRVGADEEWIAALTDVQATNSASDKSEGGPYKSCSNLWDPSSITSRPRVMIRGPRGMSHADVAAALLQKLESYQTFNIDISSLLADGSYLSAEQALVSRIVEARRAAPCVVYLPDVLGWWRAASDSLRTVLASQLDSIPVNLPVLWVSSLVLDSPGRAADARSMEAQKEDDTDVVLDERLRQVVLFLSGGECGRSNGSQETSTISDAEIFTKSYASVVDLSVPTQFERSAFFKQFFESLATLPNTLYEARKSMYASQNQVLKVAEVTSSEGNGQAGNDGPRSGTAALADINEDRDKNFMREQRVFFRAALSELLKEKRFQSLWRPVDPEQVPDYYDIITAPMDLETMRCKVDMDLYPTYKYFLYDIEQIIFNAKEYNPLNSKDSRGRSIVSAAHNMLDVVETHAYGFKQRLGYDVFQRCEEVCLRRGMERWKLEPSSERREVMPEENKIFYASVLSMHEEVKREMMERDGVNVVGTEMDGRAVEGDGGALLGGSKRGHASAPPHTDGSTNTRDNSTAHVDDSLKEHLSERELRRLLREQAAAAETLQSCQSTGQLTASTAVPHSPSCDMDQTSDQVNERHGIVETESTNTAAVTVAIGPEFDECPVSEVLRVAMGHAHEMVSDGLFVQLVSQAVDITEGWTVAQLLSIYSGLNRCSRKFQNNYDWLSTIKEISGILKEHQLVH